MIKDIKSDDKHNAQENFSGEYQRISFRHFKVKQIEISN